MVPTRLINSGDLMDIRVLRGKNERKEVRRYCATLVHAIGGYQSATTDELLLELAVHDAWAQENDEAGEALLTYVMSNTADGTLTHPYVMAVCDLAQRLHQRNAFGPAEQATLEQLARDVRQLDEETHPVGPMLSYIRGARIAVGLDPAPPDPYKGV